MKKRPAFRTEAEEDAEWKRAWVPEGLVRLAKRSLPVPVRQRHGGRSYLSG